jgi:hypothetical protein
MSTFLNLINEQIKHVDFLADHVTQKSYEIAFKPELGTSENSYNKARCCFRKELASLQNYSNRFLQDIQVKLD